MMEHKRRGRLVSARREVAEQNRIRNSYERRLARQLATLFENIAETTVREYQVGGTPTVRLENVTNRISEVLVPHYRSIILAMAERFQTIKTKQDYEQIVRNYMRDTATSRIVGISTTTQNLIRRALVEADDAAINPREAAKLIEERVGGSFGRRRAVTIARTETHAAASFANHEVARSQNVPMRKQWVATNDGRTRTWHSSINGQQVDLDEEFIVPYKGVEYRMKHTGDPNGGAHNTINCRCVTIYLEAEDVMLDDQPKPPEAVPIVAKNPWDSAVNQDINDQSISIIPAAQALRSIRQRVAASARDDRYLADEGPSAGKPVRRYKGSRLEDFGEVRLEGISDESASVLSAIMPELDDIADRLGVPRLRGFKARGGSALASMGDGVMDWNVKRLNIDTKPIKSPITADAYARSKKKIDDYEKELETRQQNLRDLRAEKFSAEFRLRQDPTNQSLRERVRVLQDSYDSEQDALLGFQKTTRAKLIDDYNVVDSRKKIDASSTWKVGDDLADRPWTADAYFEGVVNKTRTTAYHELGHHIHQMWEPKLKGFSGTGKIELQYLKGTWRHKASSPSRYGAENKKEWFAENFSAFWMGRRDLVAPRFIEIMEEVLDVQIPR